MAKSSGEGNFPPPEKLSQGNFPLFPTQFYAYGCVCFSKYRLVQAIEFFNLLNLELLSAPLPYPKSLCKTSKI